MDKKQTVFKAALGLSVLSVISKLLGFVREQAIAWRFGATALVDAYVVAMLVPQLLAGLIGGAIATSFLPVYSSEREVGSEGRVAGTTFAVTFVLSLAASLGTLMIAPLLVRSLFGSFSLEQQALIVTLLRILSIGTLLLSVSTFVAILFNGHRMFMLPALSPVMQNVVVVGSLFLLGGLGIKGLAWSTVVGMLVPAALLVIVAMYKGLPVIVRPQFGDPAFA